MAHDDYSQWTAPLLRLLAENLYIEVPAEDTDLIAAGVLDSLMLVELLVQIERTFDVTIALEELDLEQFRTVRDMARYIAQRRAAAAPRTA
jgi:acyl carrier protein